MMGLVVRTRMGFGESYPRKRYYILFLKIIFTKTKDHSCLNILTVILIVGWRVI